MCSTPARPDSEFALAEFVQLHEHIRQQDNAMIQILTVLLVASTAILSAAGAYVFEGLANDRRIQVPVGYLFLTPVAILLPGLAMLRSHRKGIYRMGTYIKVFLEAPPHGAQWHHALVEFRRVDKDESLDFVPLTIWTLTGLSIFLFWMTLVISDAPVVNWFMAAPVLLFVYFGHRDFANAKRAEELEAIWEKVRTRLVPPAASSEQPIPAQPAGGEAERPGSPQGGDNS